jgi:DNA-binding transcriptional ArsR family regulator
LRAERGNLLREILEQSQSLCPLPLHWIHTLPDPKGAITVLWALGQVPPAERLPLLGLIPALPADVKDMLRVVVAEGNWDQGNLERLRIVYQSMGGRARPSQELAKILDGWAHAGEVGDAHLQALHSYYEVFFAEEEKRLRPMLHEGLSRAQELAEGLAVSDFLEELSQVRVAELPQVAELVVVPSYWSSPRVTLGMLSEERAMWVFGARPHDASLVPGEVVPDVMLRRLKALGDPTRLRILQYLAGEPLTSAQIARRLRLRTQTVAHHLKILRLAELVYIAMDDVQAEKRYTTRTSMIAGTFDLLEGFVEEGRTKQLEGVG